MAVNTSALRVPGHGTIFHAPSSATLPTNPLTAFTLTGTPPTGWKNMGHTSRENLIEFTKDGGDPTSKGTWLQDSTSTIYSDVSWKLNIKALQVDRETLDLAFNGDVNPATGGYIVPGNPAPLKIQLFILVVDNSGKMAFHAPSTDTTLGDPPSFNREEYFEIPLTSSINTVPASVLPEVDGRAALMQWFSDGLDLTP